MKILRNRNSPPNADLVQYFIDTAYDNVKLVADNLDALLLLANAIEAGDLDNFLATTDIDTLVKLNALVLDATLGSIETLATVAQGILADNAIAGPFASQGEAEGGTDNIHAVTPLRVAQAIAAHASTLQNNYAAAVNPTVNDDANAGYAAGSFWINTTASPHESYRCTDPTVGAAVWIHTTLSADELATVAISGDSDDLIQGVTKLLMTTAERASLGTMEDNAKDDQTGAEIKILYEAENDTNAFTDTEKSKLGGIAPLATIDQTDVQIETAYNNRVAVVLQAEAEAGTSSTVRRWTAERIKQAIAALASGGYFSKNDAAVAPGTGNDTTEGYVPGSLWIDTTADKAYICLDNTTATAVWVEFPGAGGGGGGMTALYKTGNFTASADEIIYSDSGLEHTLPITPNTGDRVSFVDAEDDATAQPIIILRNGETIKGVADDFEININGGQVNFMYDGTTWQYSYVFAVPADHKSADTRIATGITDTILASDRGKNIVYTNAAAIAVTWADGLPVNFHCTVKGITALPTVTPSGSDTLNGAGTGLAPSAVNESMYLQKYDTGKVSVGGAA